MNETNVTEIVHASQPFAVKTLSIIGAMSDWVSDKIAYAGINFPSIISKVLTVFIAILLLFWATKIMNKTFKIILYILGIILIIGTGWTIFAKFFI